MHFREEKKKNTPNPVACDRPKKRLHGAWLTADFGAFLSAVESPIGWRGAPAQNPERGLAGRPRQLYFKETRSLQLGSVGSREPRKKKRVTRVEPRRLRVKFEGTTTTRSRIESSFITAQTLDMATSILGVSLAFVFEGEQQHKKGGEMVWKKKKKSCVKVGAWLLCFAFPLRSKTRFLPHKDSFLQVVLYCGVGHHYWFSCAVQRCTYKRSAFK